MVMPWYNIIRERVLIEAEIALFGNSKTLDGIGMRHRIGIEYEDEQEGIDTEEFVRYKFKGERPPIRRLKQFLHEARELGYKANMLRNSPGSIQLLISSKDSETNQICDLIIITDPRRSYSEKTIEYPLDLDQNLARIVDRAASLYGLEHLVRPHEDLLTNPSKRILVPSGIEKTLNGMGEIDRL